MSNKTLVVNRIRECLVIAKTRFPQHDLPMPTIRFDKSGQVAGTANGSKWQLNFNMTLLNENVDHFVRQTVAHELAHLINYKVYDSGATRFDHYGRRLKRQPHGINWKNIMCVLGVSPDRCHNYDTSSVRRRSRRKSTTHDYQCTGCNAIMPMGVKRHNNMQTGMRTYHHNGCKGAELIYLGITK